MKIEYSSHDVRDCTEAISKLVRRGHQGQIPMFEQEINFDAGHTPARHEWKIVKEEWIDGKRYNVYS